MDRQKVRMRGRIRGVVLENSFSNSSPFHGLSIAEAISPGTDKGLSFGITT
jgi:hypothetical protein